MAHRRIVTAATTVVTTLLAAIVGLVVWITDKVREYK